MDKQTVVELLKKARGHVAEGYIKDSRVSCDRELKHGLGILDATIKVLEREELK